MIVQGTSVNAATLEEILPAPELDRWLGDAYGRFVQMLFESIGEISLICDTRMSDQELVRAGENQGVVFIGVRGYSRLVPRMQPCTGSARPASIVLSPGELCGECEAGLAGRLPRPFNWNIYSQDRGAGVLRLEPTLVQRMFSVPEIAAAMLRQYLAWSNDALHRGYLPRWQRELATTAHVLMHASSFTDANIRGPLDVVVSKNRIALTIGCNRRRMDQIFNFFEERDLIEMQSDGFAGTRCRIRSVRAFREIEHSGCDPRHHDIRPPDHYKRRRDRLTLVAQRN
jgi:hypothetical protein